MVNPLRNDKHFALIQGGFGGILAGMALLQSGVLLMPIALAILLSASRFPLASSLWGGLAILISHSWLLGLHPLNWIGVPSLLSLPLTILIWLFCGFLGCVLCGGWSWLGEFSFIGQAKNKSFKTNFFHILFMASIWGLGEVILAQLPLFWIGVGNALLPQDRLLAGLARWIGAGGLVVVQFLIAWWIWQTFLAFQRRKNCFKIFFIGFLGVFLAHCLGLTLLVNQKPFNQKSIALWQTAIPTREKFSAKQMTRTPHLLISALNKSEEMGASLMLAPEGTININQQLISPTPIPLFAGGFRLVEGAQRSSILFFDKYQSIYSAALDKHRLVPLGEWVPSLFGNTFKGLSALGGLEPGDDSRLFRWEDSPFAAAICYELSDGSSLAKAIDQGAEWIISLANLDPYPLSLQRQFISLGQLRSIETGRDLVISANTGPTSLISSNGKVNNVIPPFVEGVDVVEVNLFQGSTGYVQYGELPILVILIIGFINLLSLRGDN